MDQQDRFVRTRQPRLPIVAGTLVVILLLASCIQPFQANELSVLTDENAPMIELSDEIDNSLFNGSVIVSGSAWDLDGTGAIRGSADPALVPVLLWEVPAFGDSGEITPNADGTFSFVLDTSVYDRDITLVLTATDANGNSITRTVSLRYDARGPVVSVTSPESNSIFDRIVTVSGTVHDIDRTDSTESIDSVSWTVIGTALGGDIPFEPNTGQFEFSIDTVGISTDIVVRIEARDIQGDLTTHVLQLLQDDLGPGITIATPENYSEFRSSVSVSGSITNRPGVSAFDEVASASFTALNGTATGSIDLGPSGDFSFSIDTEGVNTDIVVTVSAVDVHGFSSSESIVLVNDDLGPWITIDAPSSGYYGPLIALAGSVRNAFGDAGLGEVDTSSAAWSIPGTALSGTLALDGVGGFAANIDATTLTINIVLEVSADDRNGNTTTQSVSLLKPTGGGDVNVEAQVETGEIVFTWNDVTGASSYRMEEGVFGGIRDNITKDFFDEYRWSGLRNGTFHEFQLFATVPGFPDAASTTVTIAPMSTRTFVPQVVPSTFGQNHVFWQPSLTSGARYLLERRDNGGAWSSVTVTGNTQYIDTEAVKGNTYEYRVTLRNNGSSMFNTSGASSIVRPHQYPATPTFANQFSISSSTIEDAEVSGDTLFVTAGETLFAFDLTDPVNPAERDSLPNVGDFFVVSGDYLYGIDDQTLTTVDVSDPGSLAILDTVDYTTGLAGRANDHYSLAIDETGGTLDTSVILYVLADRATDSESGVVVFDVTPGSHASNPDPLGTITGSGGDGAYGHDIAVIDDNIFLSREDDDVGHATVDISGVGSTSVSAIPGGYTLSTNLTWVKRVLVGGDTLFVRDVLDSFEMFDVSTPTAPSYIGASGGGAYSGGGLVYDSDRDEVIIADEFNDSIMIYDVSDPLTVPGSTDYLPGAGAVRDVAISGGYIYGVGSGGTISILDRTAPILPAVAGSVPLVLPIADPDDSTRIADVAVSGNIAYALGDRGDLWAIDFSSPGMPFVTDSIRATFSFNGLPTRDFAVAGDVLYVASGATGVIAVDISDPGDMSAVDRGSSSNRVQNIEVFGEYIFSDATTNTYLEVYNASDTTNIVFVDQFAGGGNGGVAVDQNYLYVGSSTGSIEVYDITDPVAPLRLQTYTETTGSLYDLHVSNGYLYAYTSGGTDIIDIRTDRDAIVEVGSIPNVSPQGSWGNAVVEGSFAYVASDDSLDVFDVSNPASIGPAVGTIPVNAGPVAVSGRYAVVGHRDALQVTIIDLGE